MKQVSEATTTLLQLVESVSSHTRDDLETVQVIGSILNRHRFVVAGDEDRSELFVNRLASLRAPH